MFLLFSSVPVCSDLVGTSVVAVPVSPRYRESVAWPECVRPIATLYKDLANSIGSSFVLPLTRIAVPVHFASVLMQN